MSAVTLVRDPSQVGEARRAALQIGRARGLGDEGCSNAGIVVTELANNLLRHAGEGQLSMRWREGERGGLEILALDRGPGMADVDKCMRDGFSTGGTPGTGLGAVRRLADEFDIHSQPGKGTAIVARVSTATHTRVVADRRLRFAVYCVPAPGETECGDTWRVSTRDSHANFMVADGLGHGPSAALAGNAVAAVFERMPAATPGVFLEAAHRDINGTRGAAVATLQLDLGNGAVRYAGVGNIAGSLQAQGVGRGLFSHNGTLGVMVRKIQEFEYEWPLDGLLVMHSDGLQTRWSLKDYPGLALRDPALIAGVLARDFSRGNDDLTVLVARLERAA